MKLSEVMTFLEEHGDERTKATLMKHGAKEPFFGVKVSDLKKVVKKIKKDHALSLELYVYDKEKKKVERPPWFHRRYRCTLKEKAHEDDQSD